MLLRIELAKIVRIYITQIGDLKHFLDDVGEFIEERNKSLPERDLDAGFLKKYNEVFIRIPREMFFRMVLIYTFAIFEAFNKDFFAILFKFKPQMLKRKRDNFISNNSRTIKYEEILEFKEISELYEYLSKKEVEKFCGKGFDKLSKYLLLRFNMNLDSEFTDWENFRGMYY